MHPTETEELFKKKQLFPSEMISQRAQAMN
jgi:hypothetical protein